jgi:hypothetical protein
MIKGVISNDIKCRAGAKHLILSKSASIKAELSNFEPPADGSALAGHMIKFDTILSEIKSPPI